jgi:hypothetical protein
MTRSRLSDKEPIYLELYNAITYFMSRQQLVIRAIVEQGVNPADFGNGVGAWYDKTPQVGQWGSEWRFFFHGGGCTLRNRMTGEDIDFNGPDIARFGPYSFIQHLEWRLAQDHDLPLLREYVAQNDALQVKTLIDDLIADGIITPNYRLIPTLGDTQASAA